MTATDTAPAPCLPAAEDAERSLAKRWVLRLLAGSDAGARYFKRMADNDIVAALVGYAPCGKRRCEDEWRRHLVSTLEVEERTAIKRIEPLFHNIDLLATLIPLSPAERETLAFRVLYGADEALENVTDGGFSRLSDVRLARVLAVALNRSPSEMEAVVRPDSPLFASGFMRLDARIALLSDKMPALPGLLNALQREHRSAEDLIGFAAQRSPDPSLTVDDYPHLIDDLNLLLRYVPAAASNGLPGVNVLLHGAPGVGKTELVRVVAQQLDMRLYEVGNANECGGPLRPRQRFDAYLFNQRLFASDRRALVLFDEAEDVFPDPMRGLEAGKDLGCDKAWINRLLETNPVPTFWIANRISQLDGAYLRRFDYVIEMRNPPRSVRHRILRHQLRDASLSELALSRHADNAHLTPALAQRAVRIVRHAGLATDAQAALHFDRVVTNYLDAQGISAAAARYSIPSRYALDNLNTSVDLLDLTTSVKRAPFGRILLHGPPGTGKTCYAHYLARELDRPLLLRRASDLQSMWVGGTEKNIVQMFREAAAEGALLLLDEADNFLQDRRHAVRSWEISQVNELLAQMECHEGVFVCATNFIDHLDAASLRRFAVKIRFDYPSAEQRWALFLALWREVGDGNAADDDLTRARRKLDYLSNLAPGDFAVVRQQSATFSQRFSVERILRALEEESRLKSDGQRRPIGFAGPES